MQNEETIPPPIFSCRPLQTRRPAAATFHCLGAFITRECMTIWLLRLEWTPIASLFKSLLRPKTSKPFFYLGPPTVCPPSSFPPGRPFRDTLESALPLCFQCFFFLPLPSSSRTWSMAHCPRPPASCGNFLISASVPLGLFLFHSVRRCLIVSSPRLTCRWRNARSIAFNPIHSMIHP